MSDASGSFKNVVATSGRRSRSVNPESRCRLLSRRTPVATSVVLRHLKATGSGENLEKPDSLLSLKLRARQSASQAKSDGNDCRGLIVAGNCAGSCGWTRMCRCLRTELNTVTACSAADTALPVLAARARRRMWRGVRAPRNSSALYPPRCALCIEGSACADRRECGVPSSNPP